MKILLPLAALAAGVLVAPAAYAGTPTRTVSVADLRLDTPEGRTRLDHRIARAARDVCTSDAQSFPQARNEASACRAATIAAVAPQRAVLLAQLPGAAGIELSAR